MPSLFRFGLLILSTLTAFLVQQRLQRAPSESCTKESARSPNYHLIVSLYYNVTKVTFIPNPDSAGSGKLLTLPDIPTSPTVTSLLFRFREEASEVGHEEQSILMSMAEGMECGTPLIRIEIAREEKQRQIESRLRGDGWVQRAKELVNARWWATVIDAGAPLVLNVLSAQERDELEALQQLFVEVAQTARKKAVEEFGERQAWCTKVHIMVGDGIEPWQVTFFNHALWEALLLSRCQRAYYN